MTRNSVNDAGDGRTGDSHTRTPRGWPGLVTGLSAAALLSASASPLFAAGSRAPKAEFIDATVAGLDFMSKAGVLPIPGDQIKTLGPVIGCLAEDKPPGDCAKEAVFDRVFGKQFEQARPVVDCLISGTGNVQSCATDAAIAQLPKEGQALAKCVKDGGDPAECAVSTASTAAQKEAMRKFNDTIEKATNPITGAPILNLVRAIKEEDWAMVATLGGGEAAKIATCAVIKVVLTEGPHSKFMCDAGANLIDKRVQSARTFFDQATNGDLGGALGTLAKAGLIDSQCAGLKAVDADVEEVVCGNLGKVIDAGANEPLVVALVGSLAAGTPLVGLAILGLSELFGPDESCGTAKDYYAKNYPQCFHRAALLGITDPAGLEAFANKKRADCVRHFSECDEDKANRICDGITHQFRQDAMTLTNAFQKLANGKAKGQKSDFEKDRSRICTATSPDALQTEARDGFLASCRSMLVDLKEMPFEADANCSKPRSDTFATTSGTAYEAACRKAADTELKKVVGEVCAGAGKCFPIHECPKGERWDAAQKKCFEISDVN